VRIFQKQTRKILCKVAPMDDRCPEDLAPPFFLARVALRFISAHTTIAVWRRALASLGAAATLTFSAVPAFAYRPFDGTDGAVADLNEVEIEFQSFGWQRDGQQTAVTAPGFVFNYGFAERWEFVAQGQFEIPLSPSGPTSFAATGAFLKYLIRPGVLQDQTGLSIATEFGPLLPEIYGDRGTGFSWAGIVSQRWDWGTAHLNVEANLTRDQQGEAFLDMIVEGPANWKVRPVLEAYYDKVWTETETRSALVGAIWQVRDDLSFDAALRYAVVNGRPVDEIRVGVTFGFGVGGNDASRSGATFGQWGLSR
jgi:hypothetical protein